MQEAPTWKDIAWPTGCMIYLLFRLEPRWEDNTLLFKIWAVVVALWFFFSWINFLTKGKLTAWMHRKEEEQQLEVPDDFAKFCLKRPVNPPLKLALSQLLEGGSRRENALPDDFEITSIPDALAVCAAVKQASREAPDTVSSILPFFWNIGSADVFVIFRQLGMPLVHEHVKKLAAKPVDGGFNSDLFGGIKLLVGTAHEPAFPLVRSLSRNATTADKLGWVSVFGSIPMDSEEAPRLVEQWSAELPEAFASVAFLDWANEEFPKGTLKRHPFDTPQGMERLTAYLTDTDPGNYSYAGSATVALAYLTAPFALIARASQHPDPEVRIEAAWVKAKRGDEQGLDALAEFCRDWRTRGRASKYLIELDQEPRIPAEVRGAREQAMGTLADWLKHPNELNRFPDELEILDHREIHWPPAGKKLPVTLLRWKSENDTGVAMTGSVTWCFFSQKDEDHAIFDIYARHCNWELQANEDPSAPAEYTDLAHGRDLLTRANPQEDWTATG
jgi:hypothetical protein